MNNFLQFVVNNIILINEKEINNNKKLIYKFKYNMAYYN